MGKSKFPGKPSKLVNKKRISAISNKLNETICDLNVNIVNKNSALDNGTIEHDGDVKNSNKMSEKSENNTKTENNSGDTKTTTTAATTTTTPTIAVVTTTTITATTTNNTTAITSPTTNKAKKKTVTFKSILETSDDSNIVKKVYNPDVSVPLIPIIKKECLNYIYKTDIVKPSRLTETLEKNNKKNSYHINNDIDKLRLISFKSSSFTFPISSSHKHREFESIVDGDAITTTTTASQATTTTTGSTTAGGSASGCAIGDKRFVLPKLSAHSRRVIKPNKRFLDFENNSSLKNRKSAIKKTIVRKLKSASSEDNVDGKNSSTYAAENGENGNADEDDEDEEEQDDKEVDENDSDESVSSYDEDSHSDESESSCEKEDMSKNNFFNKFKHERQNIQMQSNKSILRQPKLQFPFSTKTSDGPFSLSFNTNNNVSKLDPSTIFGIPSTINCNICGTSINYKLTQKTMKFGITCCSDCRKFISSMNKKMAAVGVTSNFRLQCSSGEGSCSIIPITKNNTFNSKSTRSIFKERCHACWLKKCLKLFVLPPAYRTRLLKILPKAMRDLEQGKESKMDVPDIATATKTHNNLFSNKTSTCDNNDKSSNILLLWNGKSSINMNSCNTEPHHLQNKTESINFKTPTNSLLENNMTFGSSISMNIKLNLLKDKSLTSGLTTTTLDLNTNKKPEIGAKNTVINNNVNESNSNNVSAIDKETSGTNAIIEKKNEEVIAVSTETSTASTATATTTTTASTSTLTTITNATDSTNSKRQRIDLKGPRVKHVCRSASIVLGQPIATFPQENSSETDIVAAQDDESAAKNSADACNNCVEVPAVAPVEPELKSTNNKENFISNNKTEFSKPITRKITRPSSQMLNQTMAFQNNNPSHYYNTIRKQQQLLQPPPPQLISIDFWENYDPTEIHRNGFGLIITEEMPIRALCFLCGSAGHDKLQYCVCCCEPYHQFCIDDDYNIRHSTISSVTSAKVPVDNSNGKLMDSSEVSQDATSNSSSTLMPVTSNKSNSENKKNYLNWLCPRCTVCYSCNMSTGTKVCCQKCAKYYHTTCLLGTSKRLLGTDRPLICTNCLKCKSCNQANVSKFIGNLPLCLQCFRLRQKGNFCPLCQKCYDDNNFDLKMMECGDCRHWVHAKCENLTDEQYNMLSILPENIEFICKKCAKLNVNANKWRDAVVDEFKIALLSVIKLLSKSRQACTLLKLSPRKKSGNCICVCQPIQSNRSISFDNQSNSEKSNNQMEEGNCYCNALKMHYPIPLQLSSEPNLFDIKQKIIANEYFSLHEFNYDMQKLIQSINSDELLLTYKEILCETFPWFQNETKACTDALEEDMNDSCQFDQCLGNVENDHIVPSFDLPNAADIDNYFYDEFKMKDSRFCLLCKNESDATPQEESRLLYCGHNSWVHTNCALWSAEVFEEIDGSLQNVQSAISRGRSIKCCECGQKGATVGCNMKNCGEHYHFPCAKRIGCAFLMDKTVYCVQHLSESLLKKKHPQETNFEVNRSVYIELDRRKRKQIEPKKIQFMIGSLCIRKLGRFIPHLSDFDDYIVPTDYECTRLYWSSKEPWKIVEYTIKTSIQNNQNGCNSMNNVNLTFGLDLGRNFTVDHMMNANIIQRQLSQISKWHNSLNMTNDEDVVDGAAITTNNSDDTTNDEEPQSNNDLLPPEIKDAILEDLPHDILEGISMMDIFPKLMTFDDYLPMDFKSDSSNFLDLIKDNNNSNMTMISANDDESNWLAETINDMSSNANNSNLSLNRELKRNKSDMLSRSNSSSSLSGNSRTSRTNLSWSKLESNLVVKRRKINGVLVSLGRATNNNTNKKTLAGANPSATNEVISFPNKDILEKLKISQLDGMDDGMLLATGPTTNFLDSPPVKCDRCHCTYRTQDSFIRHLETCEIMSSTSESESDTHSPDIQQQQQQQLQQPQQQTTQIHTSHSITEIYNNNANNNNLMSMINLQQQQIPISINNANNSIQISNMNNKAIQNAIPISLNQLQPSFPIHQNITNFNANSIQNMLINQQQQQHQQQQIFAQPIPIGNYQQQLIPIQNLNQLTIDGCNNANLNTQEFIQTTKQQQRIISQPQTINMPQQSQIISLSSSTSSSNMNGNNSNNMSQQIMTIGQQQITQSSPKKQLILPHTANTKKQALPRLQQSPRTPKNGRNGNSMTKSMQLKKIMKNDNMNTNNTSSYQIINTSNMPMIRQQTTSAHQQQQQNILFQPQIQQQPIILQQPQSNIISYITADGQYVTLPTATTTNGVFQLPTADNSNNLIFTTNNNGTLSVIPANSLQLAQPQVIGTIIQPQNQQTSANGLSCGVEQMLLAATGGATQQPTSTLEMVQDPTSGCMYLTTQPIYYGLETIVQNTVMSSQQFVSTATAMQGVLSQNSSFSATTTQVFQASKIEPIVEMPTSYVVLGDGNNLNIIPQQQQPQSQQQATILPTIQFPAQQPTQHIQIQPQQQPQQPLQSWKIIEDKPNYIQQTQPQQIPLQQQQQQQQPQLQQPQILQAKPIVKSQPIVVQKIQPQLINKVIPNAVGPLPTTISTPQQSCITSIDSQSLAPSAYNQQAAPAMHPAPVKANGKLGNKPKMIAKPVASSLKRVQHINNKQPVAIKPNNSNMTKLQSQQTKMINIQSTIMQVSQEPQVQQPKQQLVQQQQAQKQVQNQQFATPLNIEIDSSLKSDVNHTIIGNQPKLDMIKENEQISNTILMPSNSMNSATFNAMPLHNQFTDTQQQQINNLCQQINSQQQQQQQQQINISYQLPQQQQLQQSQQQQQQHQLLSTNINQSTNDGENCNLAAQVQQQTINNSSIQLPTSPYLPYNPNCNIPTNVVNPIQQCNTINSNNNNSNNNNSNMSSNATTRPTNRVLPMQTVTQRQTINQEQQNSPVKTKIHIEQLNSMDDIVIVKNNETSPPTIADLHSTSTSNNRTIATTTTMTTMASNNQQNVNNFSNIFTNNQDHEKMNDIGFLNDQEMLSVSGNKTADMFEKTGKLVSSYSIVENQDVLNNIVNSADNLIGDDEDDDSNMRNSGRNTPDIKEKICEILINLDDEEDCNKNTIKMEEETVSETMGNFLSINANDIVAETKVEASDNKENCSNMIEDSKENLNSLPTITSDDFSKLKHQSIMDENLKLSSHATESSSSPDNVNPNLLMPQQQNRMNSNGGSNNSNPSDNSPKLLYEIQSQDGFVYKSTSIVEIWEKLFEAVQIARKAHGIMQLPEGPLTEMCGVQMLGLKTNALKYLLEQLPGVEKCTKYSPKYHQKQIENTILQNNLNNMQKYEQSEFDELKENASGTVRCEPYSERSEYDMFSWLASRHRKQPIPVVMQSNEDLMIPRRGSGSNLPMAMRYRTLKETYKESVGVYRSHIHGRGLFCIRDIEAGEMVIEYAGELIRSTLTDKRERYYDGRGIGCYMFKIDDNLVVDATMRGNAARFINHSCEPNCYSKVVDILGHKHIIIFALRRIVEGEELTYDYKFPFEDIKIPCSCGSKKCRKYLN